jgi:hypothetical protein
MSRIVNSQKAIVLPILLLFLIIMSYLQLVRPLVSVRQGMGDAQVRVYEIVNNSVEENGVWQPLYFKILKIAIDLWGPYIGPRALGIASFLLLCTAIYLLTLKLFKKHSIAQLTILLLITSNFFTDYLTFPITEVLFAAFYIFGICLLFSSPKNNKFLVWSLVFFTLANALRFEGWTLLPVVIYVMWQNKMKSNKIILFSIAYAIYPLIYIGASYSATRNLTFILKDYLTQTKHSDVSAFSSTLTWLYKYFVNFNPVYFILLLFFYCGKSLKYIISKEEGILLILSLVSLAIPILLRAVIVKSNWYPDQYLFFPIAILYPLLGNSLYNFVKINKIFLIAIFLVTIYSLSKNYYFKTANYKIPEISQKLKQIDSECLYLFDKNKYPYDKDEIMYLGEKVKYNPLEWNSPIRKSAITWFNCIVLDGISNNEIDSLKNTCKVEYSDNRFLLLECHKR